MKNQIEISLDNTGNKGIKNLGNIVISKSENVFRDLREFIYTLNEKFEFNDEDKFLEDFIKLVHFDLSGNSAKDLEVVEDKFFEMIRNNSSKPDLETNMEKSVIELEKFVNGIKVWRKKK